MDPTDNVIQFSAPNAPIGADQPLYSARRHHSEAIRVSLSLVEETLLNDLAKLYRLKAAGQPVEIPTEIIVKDVVVRLS